MTHKASSGVQSAASTFINESSTIRPVPDLSHYFAHYFAAKSPNLNAHLERFFGSLKSECLDKMIFFGEKSLRNATKEFVIHYHGERNHQGLENKIIEPGSRSAKRRATSSAESGWADC